MSVREGVCEGGCVCVRVCVCVCVCLAWRQTDLTDCAILVPNFRRLGRNVGMGVYVGLVVLEERRGGVGWGWGIGTFRKQWRQFQEGLGKCDD